MTQPSDRSGPPRRALLGVALATPVALASFVAAKAMQGNPGDGETLDLFDVVPPTFHAGIRARTVDNAPARAAALAGYIQQAIDLAAARRVRLTIPAGLYNIAPIATFASEAGPCRRCFAMRSHMHLNAEAGATFRIVNGVSRDAAVVFMCMFGSDEQLVDLSWRGLAMDMNGQRNPISPGRARDQYSLLNQAHIFISGTPGGQAACARNVTIERCTFANTPGVSCIVMAQSNTYGVALGRNWRITDSRFVDGGLDTPDHSAIFAWATDVVCERCTFSNAAPKSQVGGNVAYEVHGSRQWFVNNRISNYYQGVWIDGNRSERTSNDITVAGNILRDMSAFGIMFYGTECRMRDVRVIDNVVAFNDIVYPGVDLKIGIGCLAPLGQQQVVIHNNTVSSASRRTASSGVSLLSPAKSGELLDGFVIENNSFSTTTFGVQIVTNPACGMGAITVRTNRSTNLSRAGAFEVPQGIGVDFLGGASPIRELIVEDNICTDDRGTGAQCAFGVRLQGTISRLRIARNIATGMTAAPYGEGQLAVATRQIDAD